MHPRAAPRATIPENTARRSPFRRIFGGYLSGFPAANPKADW
jgi:hypothetical protein